MEDNLQRYQKNAENSLDWQPFLVHFLGHNPEPGTTMSIVPTIPTSSRAWDHYFSTAYKNSKYTSSKEILTVLGDIGDVPEDWVDLERWVVVRDTVESGNRLRIVRENPYRDWDLPYHLVLASEWLFKAKQMFTRQLFQALPFHPEKKVNIIEFAPDEIRNRIGDYPVPYSMVSIGSFNPEYHNEIPLVNKWIKKLRQAGHRFSNFRLKAHTLCKSISPQISIEGMGWTVQYKNVQSVRHTICIPEISDYPSLFFLVNTAPEVDARTCIDWVNNVKERLGKQEDFWPERFFNPMLDWESIDTDSLSDEDQYWETMSQDFPSDTDWIDDTWIHGPNLPGDVIWDIPEFLVKYLGQDPEIGTTVSICNTQIFKPTPGAESRWAREDHIYLRHPSVAPESPLDIERFIIKIKNDWEDQMFFSEDEEFNWDNITFSYYLVREDKYEDGRQIDPNAFFGLQEWLARVKEVLDQDLVAELPFYCYDYVTDQYWSWQTIIDIPKPIQDSLGKLPPPYAQIGCEPNETSPTISLEWWYEQLTAGGITLSSPPKVTISVHDQPYTMEEKTWTVWYRSERDIDSPVGYALGTWAQTPIYATQWVQQPKGPVAGQIHKDVPKAGLIERRESTSSEESEETSSYASSLEEETDFRRLQCRWLGRLGPGLPPDTCQIPDWMKLVLGNKPELGTTISICQTLRLDTSVQNQLSWSELITPFGPYTTKRRKLAVLGPMGHLPKSPLDYERLTFALSDDFLGYLEEYGFPESEWSWELIKQNGYLLREQSYLEGRSFDFPVFILDEWLMRAREVYVKQDTRISRIVEQEELGIVNPIPSCLKRLLGDQPAPGTHVSLRSPHVKNKLVLETWVRELQRYGHQFTTDNQNAIILVETECHEDIQDPLADISFVIFYDLTNPTSKLNSHYWLMVEEDMQGKLSREDIAKWSEMVKQVLRN